MTTINIHLTFFFFDILSSLNCRSDLAKPASTLYMHNLTGVLETAIRATNAQYADPEIIERLDCRLLEVSQPKFLPYLNL